MSSSRNSNNKNFDAKTFFNVINEGSLINMGINPTWNDLPALRHALESAFEEIGGIHYTAICRSEQGLYHIHDAVTFPTTKRRNAVSKMFGNCHVEEMRGTKEQAADYIEKNGKFKEKGEDVLVIFGNKDGIKDNQGKRTDLCNFDNEVLTEYSQTGTFDLNNYILMHCSNITQERILQSRFERILRKYQPTWRPMRVIYVEGESGSGKSRGAVERFPNAFRTNVSDKTNFPFNGYQGEDVLWLDELRPGIFRHAEFMQILDGYKMDIDVKYGRFPALWSTVVITSAFSYNDWYKDGMKYEIGRKEFERRITERYIAKDGEWIQLTKDENGNWHEPSQDFMPIDSKSDIPFLNE